MRKGCVGKCLKKNLVDVRFEQMEIFKVLCVGPYYIDGMGGGKSLCHRGCGEVEVGLV